MLFYVPPMLPVMAKTEDGVYDTANDELFSPIEKARLPMEFMASLFSAGNVDPRQPCVEKTVCGAVVQTPRNGRGCRQRNGQMALDECNMERGRSRSDLSSDIAADNG